MGLELRVSTNDLKNYGDNVSIAVLCFASMSYVMNLFTDRAQFPNRIHEVDNFSANNKIALIFWLIPTLAIAFSYNTLLIERHEYIPTSDSISISKKIYFIFTPISLLLIGASSLSVPSRLLLSSASILIGVMLDTRLTAILPLILLVASYLKHHKLQITQTFMAVTASTLLALVVIQLRRSEAHGLLPYSKHLLDHGIDFSLLVYVLKYIFLFGYAAGTYAMVNFTPPVDSVYYAFNPLLGSMIGYNDISPSLRINEFCPFPGISELAMHSWTYVYLLFAMLAIYFNYIDRRYIQLKHFLSDAFASILLLITAVVSLYLVQYNLRTSIRFLYFMALLSELGVLMINIKKALKETQAA